MQDKPLTGKNIAIMVANGFDEVEFVEPQKQLLAAGATVKAVSRATGLVNGWDDGSWGHFFPVDADKGRTVTSSADTREALEAAGASWEEVASVTEGNLVTASGVEGIAEMIQSFSALINAFENNVTEAA